MDRSAALLLRQGIERLGLNASYESIVTLETYARELLLWNPTHKLVALGDDGSRDEELAIRHLLDALAPLPIIQRLLPQLPQPLRLADAGSGCGIPGIPLSIFLPDLPMTLIERSGRRAGFLRNALIQCCQTQIGIEEKDLREVSSRFSLIVFRALRPLPEIFSHLDRITLPGGALFAYKGKAEPIRDELAALKPAAARGWESELIPLEVPFLASERHICLLRKPMLPV